MSAGMPGPLPSIFSLEPGIDRQERRGRSRERADMGRSLRAGRMLPRREHRAISRRGGAHPDVRPLDRRPEPRLRRRGVRGRTEAGGITRRRRSPRRARSSTRTTSCARRSASPGSARARSRPASRREPRAAAAAVAVAAAAGCTPSSTSSTTGRCGAGDVLTGDDASPARPGRRKAAAPASWCSRETSPSTATRTASWSSPPAASACAPSARSTAAGRSDMALSEAAEGRRHRDAVARRRPEAHADRAVRRRVRRLQPAAHRRDVHHRGRRLPGVFAHGMLTMGMTGRMLHRLVRRRGLPTYGVRFVKQVWPGDTLTATATVTAVNDGDGRSSPSRR